LKSLPTVRCRASAKGGTGRAVFGCFQRCEAFVGVVGLYETFAGVDVPAELAAVIEAMEDVAGDAGGGLFGALMVVTSSP
jgi:hypothetical protein